MTEVNLHSPPSHCQKQSNFEFLYSSCKVTLITDALAQPRADPHVSGRVSPVDLTIYIYCLRFGKESSLGQQHDLQKIFYKTNLLM
jgi:hypothetical protein